MTIYSRRPEPVSGTRPWRRIGAALDTGDDATVARRLRIARAHVALVRTALALPAAARPAETAPPVAVLPAPDLRRPWERARDAYLVLIAREPDELERYLLRYKLV